MSGKFETTLYFPSFLAASHVSTFFSSVQSLSFTLCHLKFSKEQMLSLLTRTACRSLTLDFCHFEQDIISDKVGHKGKRSTLGEPRTAERSWMWICDSWADFRILNDLFREIREVLKVFWCKNALCNEMRCTFARCVDFDAGLRVWLALY